MAFLHTDHLFECVKQSTKETFPLHEIIIRKLLIYFDHLLCHEILIMGMKTTLYMIYTKAHMFNHFNHRDHSNSWDNA
jgi:hypothetical protein